jgi:hypothetical protein
LREATASAWDDDDARELATQYARWVASLGFEPASHDGGTSVTTYFRNYYFAPGVEARDLHFDFDPAARRVTFVVCNENKTVRRLVAECDFESAMRNHKAGLDLLRGKLLDGYVKE